MSPIRKSYRVAEAVRLSQSVVSEILTNSATPLSALLRITQNSPLLARALAAALAVAQPSVFADDAALATAASVVTAPSDAKPAAPYDLGEDLAYVRVHRVADALPLLDLLNRVQSKSSALVLDLRYPLISEADVPALALTLAQRSAPTPLFVLVSPQTPAALVAALAKLPSPALTIGVSESRPLPAVVVNQPADVDRRAYDALDGGMSLETLITGKIEKERFDEAELVKEFENGNANAAPPPDPDPTKKADAEKAPVLTDRVLQRAVHLHRALLALKRS